ncbi:hydrogenase large subunit [Haliovirga abyssi]|uniref:Hydrogenase n=1 Tax=Haliovirga abyssi TaxID=2996794 RepID=A0AAU9E4K8_9FUSO|nr:NADH-quinone oxidoreductase subunit C [Haliovirga abyssi]BDU51450.1 hydrogenase [Haliovirga abyssi]
MNNKFINIKNGEKINLENITIMEFKDFYNEMLELSEKNAKIVQYFGFKDENKKIKLVAILRTEKLWLGITEAPNKYESLTNKIPQLNMFERELAEQFGIEIINHPWMKSLRYHKNYTGKKDAFKNDYKEVIPGNYPFYEVEGEEIHQVAVGPIHAGVIEPGHFRFNCIGEKVLHLEIQHGYQHRGVEKQLLKASMKKLPLIIESVAGDTTIGNSIAFSEAIESLADIKLDKNQLLIRGIALELERIANHVGDLGALSGDVAFLPPAAYYGRMRGDFLNILLDICGNRFGKGLIRAKKARFEISESQKNDYLKRLEQLKKETIHVGDMIFAQAGVVGRFEDTGKVNKETAEQLGMVGFTARASGIKYDVRDSFPTGIWEKVKVEKIREKSGDVLARALMRYREVKESFELVERFLKELEFYGEKESENEEKKEIELGVNSLVVTMQEGWRGELSHCVITDSKSEILRYKIKDPSFHNWDGLAFALRNEAIADFPVCNKSFNLSYCGFDL